jgi:hypothetical protein
VAQAVEEYVERPADPEVLFDMLNGGPIRLAAVRNRLRRSSSPAAMTFRYPGFILELLI